MRHYDGPAFYRSKQQLPSKKPHFIQNYRLPSGNLNEKTTKKISSHGFHPSYVPPSLQSLTDRRQQEQYQIIEHDLKKSSSSYFLFAENPQSAEELIDLEHLTNNTIDSKKPLAQSTAEADPVDSSMEIKADQAKAFADSTYNESVDKQLANQTSTDKILPALMNFDSTNSPKNSSQVTPAIESVDPPLTVEESTTEDLTTGSESSSIMANQAGINKNESETVVAESVQTVESASQESTEEEKARPNLTEVENSNISNKDETTTVNDDQIQPVDEKINENLTGQFNPTKEVVEEATVVDKADKNETIAEPQLNNSPKQSLEYQFPPLRLLPTPVDKNDESLDEWVLKEIDVLNETLKSFRVQATVSDWTIGPTVTQFEVSLARGVKVSKITNLVDDLKLALAARDIRIEAPIPGKSTVGIEIPNLHSRPVMLKEILQSKVFQSARSPLTVALGVDLFGQPRVMDLRKMPHGLIAGATGSGKSVFINSLLVSLLYKATPNQVKLLLIDPKTVEMAPYQDLPHLLAPVISDPAAAAAALKWVVEEMEQRYQRLAAAGVRNLEGYNQKAAEHGDYGLQLPYIVIVIDELADLMMVAAADVQDYIARITQKARAAGIHLLVATQRPSVDVVTGTIKNNIPTRIAFMVASQTDSRTILDTSGAERLLGKGDLLYLGNGSSQPLRLQGTYIGDEIDQITNYLKQQQQPDYSFDPAGLKAQVQAQEREDELFPQVKAYLVNEETTSTSKLQRVFSIGYNRAAGLIDELESRGYISAARGSKPRQVFLKESDLENE